MLTGGQMVCESLIREGVEVMFGLPGGAILPLYQTFPEYPALRHVLVRHEQNAGHAADGYARALKENGFVIADFAERRETIRQQAENLGRRAGGETIVGEELLETVTGLVEWPRALVGDFDPRVVGLR